MMDKKKVIIHRSEKAKAISYNLRMLIRKATMAEEGRLRRKFLELLYKKEDNEARIVRRKQNNLYDALDKSICKCPGCRQSDRDMIYNAAIREWWCTQCYKEMGDFYYKKKKILDEGGFVGDFNEKYYRTFIL